jgi:hypothetical protein
MCPVSLVFLKMRGKGAGKKKLYSLKKGTLLNDTTTDGALSLPLFE